MMGDSPVTVPQDPAVSGRWEPIKLRCHHLPIHSALLHTGKVLIFGGSCNNPKLAGEPWPAELWDLETGTIKLVEQDLAGDIFCAGHAFLPDGRLLVAGGTSGYDCKRHVFGRELPFPPFQGSNHSYLFDPVAERWTRADNMAVGRWYPALCMLGDGRIVCMAGLTQHFPWLVLRKIEVYAPGEGWQVMKRADRWLPLYPRLHLLPDGRVFYSGSYNTHYTFPFSLQQFPTSILDPQSGKWDDLGLPNQSEREEGTTFMLPLRPPDYRPVVVLAGGGTPAGTYAIADCEMMDLGQQPPRWRLIESMHHARYYAYPVILPDGRTLVLGGRSGTKGHDMPHGMAMPDEIPHDPRAVLEPELFDPATLRWTAMAPMTVDRLYHSCALLLPDGRVAAIGNNPMQGMDELRIEIYQPPYLFRGFRPSLRNAPRAAVYGQQITIESPEAGDVSAVVLIRPGATTHCVNPEQRLIELAFSHAG
ncbi:MAG: DUF1929 domain-containing protein, partial [Chloroflexi bacterium]|nr:DUF1929 domain-containing protein [Chloroflexota bacterium]